MSYWMILILVIMVACMPQLYKKIGYWHLIIFIPIILSAISTIYFQNKSTFSLILGIITFIICLVLDLYSYHKHISKKD